MMSLETIQLRDSKGWRVFVNCVRATASIQDAFLSFQNIPVYGSLAELTPWSSVQVLRTGSQFSVVVGLRARGGGCAPQKQLQTLVAPNVHRVSTSINPKAQAMAEFLVQSPFRPRLKNALPVFRLDDLEKIRPAHLQAPMALARPLMDVLAEPSHWSDPRHSLTRFRLLRLVRRFWFGSVFTEFTWNPDFSASEELIAFFAQVRSQAGNELAAEEAQLVLEALANKEAWPNWVQRVQTKAPDLLNVYFGGEPVQATAYATLKLETIRDELLDSLVQLLLLDQVFIAGGAIATDLLRFLLKKNLSVVLPHLEVAVFTQQVKESMQFLVLQVLTEHLEDPQTIEVIKEKIARVLRLLPSTPNLEYLLKPWRKVIVPRQSISLPEVAPTVVAYPTDLLETARQQLLTSGTCLVSGSPGSGKTQFFYEYAIAYQNDYDIIHWVNAHTVRDAELSMLDLAEVLGLNFYGASLQQQICLVNGYVTKHSLKCLFLFRDTPSPSVLNFLVPRGTHVLMTSQSEYEEPDITLTALSETTASELVQAMSGITPESDLRVLAGRPLALVYLARAIKRNVTDTEIIAAVNNRLHNGIPGLPSLNALVLQCFEQLNAQSNSTGNFFMHLACLPPFKIPQLIYTNLLRALHLNKSALFIKNLLVKYGFIWVSGDNSITMNRALAKIIRSSIPDKESVRKKLLLVASNVTQKLHIAQALDFRKFNSAFSCLKSCFKKYQVPRQSYYQEALLQFMQLTHQHYGILSDQFQKILAIGLQPQGSTESKITQTDALLMALKLDALTQEAPLNREKCTVLVQLLNAKYSPMKILHEDCADGYFLLGQAELAAGNEAAAATAHTHALELRKLLYQEDSLKIAESLEALAWVKLKQKADIDDVKQDFETAVRIKQKHLFSCHPSVADTLWNFGQALAAYDLTDEALNKFQLALDLQVEFYGEDHPRVAKALSKLAGLCEAKEKTKTALSYYKQAAKALKVFGLPQDFNLLFVYKRLGVLYAQLGDESKGQHYTEKGQHANSQRLRNV